MKFVLQVCVQFHSNVASMQEIYRLNVHTFYESIIFHHWWQVLTWVKPESKKTFVLVSGLVYTINRKCNHR